MSQLILKADLAAVAAEGLPSSLSLTVCIAVTNRSHVPGCGVGGPGCQVELCADTSLRINQAYQSDRCLSTCYKHLPRLAPAPSPHRLFTRIKPPYTGPVCSLVVALISDQRPATDLLH